MKIEIDASTLKVRELRLLEKARSFDDMADWLARNCKISQAEMEELTLAELMQISADLQASIKSAMALPKASGGS